MNTVPYKTLALATALALLAACGNDAPKADNAAQPNQDKHEEFRKKDAAERKHHEDKTYYLGDAAALQKAEDSLKALPKFKDKPIQYFQSIGFYAGKGKPRIIIKLSDPDKPENIDEYTYNFTESAWGEPKPVQIIGGGDVKSNLLPLSDVRFADIAEKVVPAYEQEIAKQKLENLKEDKATSIDLMNDFDGKPSYWLIGIRTDRGHYRLQLPVDTYAPDFAQF